MESWVGNLPDVQYPSTSLFQQIVISIIFCRLDYGHASGHGIDCFLSVHAAPFIHSGSTDEIQEGMLMSDEPGFYKEDQFGIRLENDMAAVDANDMALLNFTQRKFLKFETFTLVPFEPKLIEECMLTEAQISYLNEYNALTRHQVLPTLDKHPRVQEFLRARTEPLDLDAIRQRCHGDNAHSDSVRPVSFDSQQMNLVLLGLSVFSTVILAIAVWRAYVYRRELKRILNSKEGQLDKHLFRL